MPNDPRCKGVRRKHFFFGSAPFGFAALPCKDLCAYVYYYISSTGRPVVRQCFPFLTRLLKRIIMIYSCIVVFEFVLAFIGVGLLIRHYNHKA